MERQAPPVTYGPLKEEALLSAGLDYYKPTMSQLAYEQEPGVDATFTLKNRGEQRLLDYIDPAELRNRLEAIQQRGWQQHELDYLASLQNSAKEPVFSAQYLDYLKTQPMPKVQIQYDEEQDDIAIETTGPWALASFWETIVLSEINEAYFESYLRSNNIDPIEVYDEGDRRLSEKIAILQDNPDIKFADFGTRRHFSLRWQSHVIDRLAEECPQNLVGTSNVALAQKNGLRPIGTFAHEMPMGYAALADARGDIIRNSQNTFLRDWYERYGEDLSIVLPDTFSSEFFFSDFSPEQADAWRGVRHDSGDPITFGERLIRFYEEYGVDPAHKTVVFSDGLDMHTIVELHTHFKGRINVMFGWGTTLTNDLGIKPLNVVMKLTRVHLPDGTTAESVKLSDSPGKHTGPPELIAQYQNVHFATGNTAPGPAMSITTVDEFKELAKAS